MEDIFELLAKDVLKLALILMNGDEHGGTLTWDAAIQAAATIIASIESRR